MNSCLKKGFSILICIGFILSHFQTLHVKAADSLADSQITSIVEKYLSIVGTNRYWNANIRNDQNLLKTQADNKNYLSATTSSPCHANPSHSHDKYGNQGCTSNIFSGVSGGLSQCWGFGDYIEYVIFKTTDGSLWKKHYNVNSDFIFRPGDLIWSQKGSSSQHIRVVYKVVNSTVYVIEGNGDGHCKIMTNILQDPHSYVNFSSSSYVMTPPSSLRNDNDFPNPEPPADVKVSTVGSKVTVSWDESDYATSYDVYLVQSPWGWSDIKYSKSTSGTSYTFSDVASGKYKAFVIARPNENSEQSEWVSVTVKNEVPDAPVIKHNLTNGYMKTDGSVTISWDATDNTESYKYYLTEYPEKYAYNTYTKSGTVTENKIKFTDLPNGKYSIFVHARNDAGSSAKSNWISFYVYEKEYEPVKTKVHNGHIYELYDYEMSWSFAKELCENMGGHLVTITSEEESDFISDFIDNGTKDAYWLGATDFDVDSDGYCWVTGEDFDYTNWDDGEPSNSGTSGTMEHFAEIRKSYSYKWNDVNNINKKNKGFILEVEPKEAEIVAEDTFNNSKYILIDKNTTWTQAKAYSEYLGGHLVTIESQEEKSFVNNLISQGSRSWYYLGAKKSNDTWKWINGTSVKYIDWEDNASSWSGEYLMKYKNRTGCIPFRNTYYPAHDIKHTGFVCEIELPYTTTSVTKSTTGYVVNSELHNLTNHDIIITGYNNGILVDMASVTYNGSIVPAELTGDIDEIKVMVWDDAKPLCNAEVITESDFITEQL